MMPAKTCVQPITQLYVRPRSRLVMDGLWWVPLVAIMIPWFMGYGGYVVVGALLVWVWFVAWDEWLKLSAQLRARRVVRSLLAAHRVAGARSSDRCRGT
jgi:hypothetical protein